MNRIDELRIAAVAATSGILIALATSACQAESGQRDDWIVGRWMKTMDEDRDPPDSMTFHADGTFSTYDEECREHSNRFFIKDGLVFLVIPMDKGPVALIMSPSAEKTSLTFTSPRTLNNSVYERSESLHCNFEG